MNIIAMKPNYLKSLIFSLALFCSYNAAAQIDTLVMPGNNLIVGEVKGMQYGVITIETDYSDDDFTIEWLDVVAIRTQTRFLISLSNGERLNGTVSSYGSEHGVKIHESDGTELADIALEDIVFLNGVESDFWGRMSASIDFGINLTKANNFKQYNARSNVGYRADRWSAGLSYDLLRSSQDETDPIRRQEFGSTFQYYLEQKWYIAGNLNLLSNTEQALDLRRSLKFGGGRSIIKNNKAEWGAIVGIAFLNEEFDNSSLTEPVDPNPRASTEAFIGTNANLFDTGDLSLTSSLYMYPSLTESGRFRTDFSLDVKYDLPLDFYIKTGLTYNYDNQPAEAGNESDYVMSIGFGWEL